MKKAKERHATASRAAGKAKTTGKPHAKALGTAGKTEKKPPGKSRQVAQHSARPPYQAARLHSPDEVDTTGFLPMTPQEMQQRGWDRPDFVLVSGDAYVDHPSFGTAIIGRVLESQGFRVAVLPQPDWQHCEDFKRFGRPRLGFLVNSGVVDSMVNHYTSAKKPRSNDVYTPGALGGQRPDRAVIVYCNRIRQAYRKMPIIIGGLEASLRRFAHYDYWDDKVRRSVLVDAGADLLIYGMGERPIIEIAQAMDAGTPIADIRFVRGTAFLCGEEEELPPWVDENGKVWENQPIAPCEAVMTDKEKYGEAYLDQKRQMDTVHSPRLLQANGRQCVCVNPPPAPLSGRELDNVHSLPFCRAPHPLYVEHVPAIDEVEFSVASCRGCFGSCSFCALTYHQGRSVHARSHASIVQEVRNMTDSPRFKGYVHDVGGPTANFRASACDKQAKGDACTHRECLHPQPCSKLKVDHENYTELLTKLRNLPKIKKVFVRSGLRYDYILLDSDKGRRRFLNELVPHHISGQLKIAPEHIHPRVLDLMGKPSMEMYDRFRQLYQAANQKHGMNQFMVPYFISSHPGSDLEAAIELACYMKREGIRSEQVQDFYPTPGTLSTTMFYTGQDPRSKRPVFVPRAPQEKKMQRALLQFHRPEHAALVRQALQKAGREDLIGYGKEALVRPAYSQRSGENAHQRPARAQAASKGKRSGAPPKRQSTGKHRKGR